MRLTAEHFRRFEEELQRVLDELPDELLELFDEIPLVVEDRPSPQLLRELGMRGGRTLQGLHSGIPLTERSVTHSGVLPTVITIFREGILLSAVDRGGRIDDEAFRDEIRVTILHEIGHHFGMDEEDLEQYGYG